MCGLIIVGLIDCMLRQCTRFLHPSTSPRVGLRRTKSGVRSKILRGVARKTPVVRDSSNTFSEILCVFGVSTERDIAYRLFQWQTLACLGHWGRTSSKGCVGRSIARPIPKALSSAAQIRSISARYGAQHASVLVMCWLDRRAGLYGLTSTYLSWVGIPERSRLSRVSPERWIMPWEEISARGTLYLSILCLARSHTCFSTARRSPQAAIVAGKNAPRNIERNETTLIYLYVEPHEERKVRKEVHAETLLGLGTTRASSTRQSHPTVPDTPKQGSGMRFG
jgi:hypothetical protein